jgi:hypothetical protein
MSKVWSQSQHKGNALLLLLAIADNADDSGWCWPGIKYLAKKVKVTKQSIIRTTKTLESSGELMVLHNRRTGNKYIVRLGMADTDFERVLREKAPYLSDEQISNILLHNTDDTSRSNVDDTSEVTPTLHESSITVNEPSHVADATAQSTPQQPKEKTVEGEALVEQFFGPKREPLPATVTPHWAKVLGEDWSSWGHESEEMQQQIKAFGERGNKARQLGYILDKQFGLRPIWDKRKEVKSWMNGLANCLQTADGDENIVIQAATELREAGMSISSPWSLKKQTAALAAEKRSVKRQGTKPYSDEWYKAKMDNDQQLAFARQAREMQVANLMGTSMDEFARQAREMQENAS